MPRQPMGFALRARPARGLWQPGVAHCRAPHRCAPRWPQHWRGACAPAASRCHPQPAHTLHTGFPQPAAGFGGPWIGPTRPFRVRDGCAAGTGTCCACRPRNPGGAALTALPTRRHGHDDARCRRRTFPVSGGFFALPLRGFTGRGCYSLSFFLLSLSIHSRSSRGGPFLWTTAFFRMLARTWSAPNPVQLPLFPLSCRRGQKCPCRFLCG